MDRTPILYKFANSFFEYGLISTVSFSIIWAYDGEALIPLLKNSQILLISITLHILILKFMDNYLVYRKQIALEKNQEFAFKIPVLINPSECEFEIDLADNYWDEQITILFQLRSTKSGAENEKKELSFDVTEKMTTATLKFLDLQGEYLLLSCISVKNIQFAFSIRRSSTRFMI